MMAVLAINAFGFFFTLLILLLHVKVAEMSTGYHNKQSEGMPDTEYKS
jgi:uncharacterized membrane protein